MENENKKEGLSKSYDEGYTMSKATKPVPTYAKVLMDAVNTRNKRNFQSKVIDLTMKGGVHIPMELFNAGEDFNDIGVWSRFV